MKAELNPYRSPTTELPLAEQARPQLRMRIGLGLLIAPLMAPLAAAALVFAVGLLFADPQDDGTPIGIVLVPVAMLTVGSFFSYLLALVIGMPIVLLLRMRKRLNGYTIHLAAALVSLLFAVAWTAVSFSLERPVAPANVVFLFGLTVLFVAPLVLLSTAVFWWIARPR